MDSSTAAVVTTTFYQRGSRFWYCFVSCCGTCLSSAPHPAFEHKTKHVGLRLIASLWSFGSFGRLPDMISGRSDFNAACVKTHNLPPPTFPKSFACANSQRCLLELRSLDDPPYPLLSHHELDNHKLVLPAMTKPTGCASCVGCEYIHDITSCMASNERAKPYPHPSLSPHPISRFLCICILPPDIEHRRSEFVFSD